jgi:hypothetical protein
MAAFLAWWVLDRDGDVEFRNGEKKSQRRSAGL